jgi:hypothetical protein
LSRTTLSALAAAGLLLAGCSDGGEDRGAGPSGTPSASTSQSTESTEPTATEPAVEPATGFAYDLERVTMRAPEGWTRTKAPASFLLGAGDPDSVSTIILSDLLAFREQPLPGQVRIALRSRPGADVLDPVQIAGVEWYHIAGRDGEFATFDQFGTIHNDSEAVVEFSLDDDIPEDEQREIIDSVLATVDWK